MQKIRQLPYPLGLTFVLLFFFFACKKLDQSLAAHSAAVSGDSNRFFNIRSDVSPLIKAAYNFTFSQDQRYHFSDDLVKKVGFPRWENAIVIAGNPRRRTTGADSSGEMVFIPFARDNRQVVDAALAIQMEEGDTSFRIYHDWQYKDSLETGISGRQLSMLLMQLDNRVFGHTKFRILDSAAFGGLEAKAAYVFLGAGASSQRVYHVELCYTWYEPLHEGQVVGCAPGPDCPFYTEHQSCETFVWDDIDETPSGDNSGGGTGGSGGGGSGGWDDPGPCGQQRIIDPGDGGGEDGPGGCSGEGGFEPVEETEPPCDDYISVLQQDGNFIQKLSSLNTSTTINLPYETGYLIADRLGNSYLPVSGNNFSDPVIQLSFAIKIDGFMHCHFNGTSVIFSPDDLIMMAQTYISGQATDSSNLFFAMTNSTEYPFLIKVNNTSSFRNFATRITGDNGKDQGRMNSFKRKYESNLRTNDQSVAELEFLKMLKKENVLDGISIYRGSRQCDKWTKLYIQGYSQVLEKNCF